MDQKVPRSTGQVTEAIRKIEEAFIQLREEVISLEVAISPALKPENQDGCGACAAEATERSALANELDLHLDRVRGLRNRVADLVSRVDI